jgi:hypothetical protein
MRTRGGDGEEYRGCLRGKKLAVYERAVGYGEGELVVRWS